MRKSKCKFCKACVSYDERTDKMIKGFLCDIDSYDPDVGCNKHCYDYEREKKEAK